MERVHYRRVTSSERYTPRMEEGSGFKERLITQAIVSALVLAFALAVSVFENPFSASFQNGLQRVFEGHTTADALITDIQRLSQEWLNPAENNRLENTPLHTLYPNENDLILTPSHMLTDTEGESKSPVPELSVIPEP